MHMGLQEDKASQSIEIAGKLLSKWNLTPGQSGAGYSATLRCSDLEQSVVGISAVQCEPDSWFEGRAEDSTSRVNRNAKLSTMVST